MHFKTRTLQTSALVCCSVISVSSFASGFRLPELSAAGTALSNAVVANPELPGALPYNPATMAFQKQGELIVGTIIIKPDISVKPNSGNDATSQGKANIAVPNMFVTNHINTAWSWGIGINAPFGLETQWKAGTFDTFATSGGAPFEPEKSKIEMLNINPNVAYQLGNTSIALGIDDYQVRKLTFNTQGVLITGNGQDYGWNIGLLHAQKNWSVGLSYRSSVKVKLEGFVDGTPIGLALSAATAEIEFPSLFQIGARYKFNDKLAAEFDIEQTGWSSFDVIDVYHSSPGISNPVSRASNWDDAIAYRMGATYELSPTNQLRFGYAYDETPGGDEFFTARIPGNDRQTLSIGLGHEQAGWTIEFAYMYVKADDRSIGPSPAYIPPDDPNGSSAFDGDYKLSAHLIGVGVNTHF
ncbi:MAG: outer membrane protein transport protein [Ectothiorhodospiraceae bacterium]|nr:outer membrane protein transport protein [Ectothiorhodospiraceae bacterium]